MEKEKEKLMASNQVILGGNFTQLRSAVRALGGDFQPCGSRSAAEHFAISIQMRIKVWLSLSAESELRAAAAVLAVGAAYGAVVLACD